MSIEVRLKQRILPEDHSVWMVRPGKGYRLLEDFARASAIAPDIPLLDVPNRVRVENIPNLDAQIRRGRHFRDWEFEPAYRRTRPPSRAVGDYNLAEDGGHHSRNINTAIQILDELPENALVFVPGAQLGGEALLGRLASRDANRVPFSREIGGVDIEFLGRRILDPIRIDMRKLPASLTDIPKNRGYVVESVEGYARNRLYREYYGNYRIENGHVSFQFRAGERDFKATHASTLVTLGLKLDDIAAGRDDQGLIGFLNLLGKERPDAPVIHARINSPFGRLTAESTRRGISVLATILALAALDSDAQVIEALEAGSVEIIAGCDDEVAIAADQEKELLYDFYASMGADDCKKVLELGRSLILETEGEFGAEAE